MTLPRLAFGIAVCAAIGLCNNVNAEEPNEVLQRRVGTWINEVTQKKAEWTPEEKTYKGEETTRWILDKTVQVHEGWQKPGDLKTTGLILYDKQAKLFRAWQFNNKGVFPRSETTGQWDAKTETLSSRSDLGNGNKLRLKIVYCCVVQYCGQLLNGYIVWKGHHHV